MINYSADIKLTCHFCNRQNSWQCKYTFEPIKGMRYFLDVNCRYCAISNGLNGVSTEYDDRTLLKSAANIIINDTDKLYETSVRTTFIDNISIVKINGNKIIISSNITPSNVMEKLKFYKSFQ